MVEQVSYKTVLSLLTSNSSVTSVMVFLGSCFCIALLGKFTRKQSIVGGKSEYVHFSPGNHV